MNEWEDVPTNESKDIPTYEWEDIPATDVTENKEEINKVSPTVEEKEVEIEDYLTTTINKIEQLKIDNPQHSEHYDLAIMKAKEGAEDKKIKATSNEIKKLKNKKALEELRNAPDAMDRTIDSAEGMTRGAGRMFLGLGKVGQDALSNLTDEEYKVFDTWIQENEQVITDKGLEGSAMVGEVLSNILPVARLKALGYIVASEGIMATTASLGKGEDYKEATTKGAIAGTTAGVTGAIINKFFPDLPSKDIDTDFGKQIAKLDTDDQKRINEVLDYLDDNQIKAMDNDARDEILSSVFKGKKSSSEISKEVIVKISEQKEIAKKAVKDAYDEAGEIASSIKTEPIKEAVKTKEQIGNMVDQFGKPIYKTKTSTKKILKEEDRLILKYEPKNADEVADLVKINKELKDFKKGYSVKDLESKISFFKGKQADAERGSKNLYGEAISMLQKKQDKMGGIEIYKKARKLSKDFNTEYTGIIKEGEEATAGATTAKVIKNQYTEYAGEMLLGRNVNPNKIGEAVSKLKTTQKQSIVQDLLIKGVKNEDINTPEGVKKILQNYKAIDPVGLAKLVGKTEANKIGTQMKSLNEIELAIKSAKGQDLSIADDVLSLATAGATAKLSPYLAARTTIYASKNILKKFSSKAEKAKLIARTKKIENNRLRTTLMRAIGLASSSLAEEK